MTLKVIFKTSIYILKYTEHCFSTNKEYTKEDIEWIIYHFCESYPVFCKDPVIMYRMLSLVNINKFCGFFALTYNNSILKSVKERDVNEFKNLILNPNYIEINDTRFLNKDEIEELNFIFEMETFIHNLILKRIVVSENEDFVFDELYKTSYNEIYNNFFSDKIIINRADFQNFVFLTEYNTKTRNSHVYTYKLDDILIQCITEKFTYEISKNNIDILKNRFAVEMKLITSYLL
jgi:hypothetical protein